MRLRLRKDLKYRRNFLKFEKKQKVLKSIIRSFQNFFFAMDYRLTYLSFKSVTLSKIKNRCIFTQNARSVNRQYRISRNVFRAKVTFAKLYGFSKK